MEDLRGISRVKPPLQMHHTYVLILGGGGAGTRSHDDVTSRGGGGGGGAICGLANVVSSLGICVVIEGGVAGCKVEVVALGGRPALFRAAGQKTALVFGADGHAGDSWVLEATQTIR